jgi:hypothetical protein
MKLTLRIIPHSCFVYHAECWVTSGVCEVYSYKINTRLKWTMCKNRRYALQYMAIV